MESDIHNIVNRITERVGFDLSRRIDREIQAALRDQAPFAYRILLLCRRRLVTKLLSLAIERRDNFATNCYDYRVLILGRCIGRFSVYSYQLV
jgi:hypothetical protein